MATKMIYGVALGHHGQSPVTTVGMPEIINLTPTLPTLELTPQEEKTMEYILAKRWKTLPAFSATAADGSTVSVQPKDSPLFFRQYAEMRADGTLEHVKQEICFSTGRNRPCTMSTVITVKEKSIEKYIRTLLPNRRVQEDKWTVDANGSVQRTSKLTLRNNWTVESEYQPGCQFTTIRKDGEPQLALHTTANRIGDQMYFETKNVDGSDRTIVVGGQLFGPMTSLVNIGSVIGDHTNKMHVAGTYGNGTNFVLDIIDGPSGWNRSGKTLLPDSKGSWSASAHSGRVGGAMGFHSSMSGFEESEIPGRASSTLCVTSAAPKLGDGYQSTMICTTSVYLYGSPNQRIVEDSTWQSNSDGTQTQTDKIHVDNPTGVLPLDGGDPSTMGTSDKSITLNIDSQGNTTEKRNSTSGPVSDSSSVERKDEKEGSGPGDFPGPRNDGCIGMPNPDGPDGGPAHPNAMGTGPADNAFVAHLSLMDSMLSGNHFLMISSSSDIISETPTTVFASIGNAALARIGAASSISVIGGGGVVKPGVHVDLTTAIAENLRTREGVILQAATIVNKYLKGGVKLPEFTNLDTITGKYM